MTLLLCGMLLLISIGFGQRLGDRVLRQSTARRTAVVVPSPSTPPTETPQTRKWKRDQVISVATDPAFPDPRVTPTPPPPPPPPRRVVLPKFTPETLPSVRRTPKPLETNTPSGGQYTSPPLPIPLMTRGSESAAPTQTPVEGPTPP